MSISGTDTSKFLFLKLEIINVFSGYVIMKTVKLDKDNSIKETMHLLSSKANADRLFASIKAMNKGKGFEKILIEE